MLTYRSVFISDVHLGTQDAKVDYLIDFLTHVQCERLYLVGDIIDVWKMRSGGWRWPRIKHELIQLLLKRANEGVEIIYVPGNHDEAVRYLGEGEAFGVKILPELVHHGADGRRWLVVHGDGFDAVLHCNPLMRWVGDMGYELLMRLARITHGLRRLMGRPYWSLAASIKGKMKNAMQYVEQYEHAAYTHAREHGYDGIISGHIHHARLREVDGVTYANCGDWVESCTALAEDASGQFHLLHWARDHLELLDGVRAGRQEEACEPEACLAACRT